MSQLNLDQAVAAVSGLGYAIVFPPNEEQQANDIIGIVCIKTYTEEFIGNYAFIKDRDEVALANFQRFKKVLKRKGVQYQDGTGGEVKWLAL